MFLSIWDQHHEVDRIVSGFITKILTIQEGLFEQLLTSFQPNVDCTISLEKNCEYKKKMLQFSLEWVLSLNTFWDCNDCLRRQNLNFVLKDIVSGSSNSRINVSFHTKECLVKLLTIVTVQVKKFHSKSTFARLDWKFYVSSCKNSDFWNSVWCSQLKFEFSFRWNLT